MSGPSIKRYDSGEFEQVDIDSPRDKRAKSRWNTWSGSNHGNSQICCGGLFGTHRRWVGGETWTDVAASYLFPMWTIITWRIISAVYLSITSVFVIITKCLKTHPLSSNLYLLETLSALLLLVPYFLHTKPPNNEEAAQTNLPPTPSTPLTSPLYTLAALSFQSTTALTLTHTILILFTTTYSKSTLPAFLTPVLTFFAPIPILPDLLFANLPHNPIYHLIPLIYLTLYLLPHIINKPDQSSPLYNLLYNPKRPLPRNNPGIVCVIILSLYMFVAMVLYLLYRLRASCIAENIEAVEYSLRDKDTRDRQQAKTTLGTV